MTAEFDEVFEHYDAHQRVRALKTLLAMRKHSHFLAETL